MFTELKNKKGAKNISCYLPSGFLCLIKKHPNKFRNSWIDYKLRNYGVIKVS